jgi:predicted nucleic acid-binding protein
VAKHLIDTNLYVDVIQTGGTPPVIRELYEREAPGIYFSSVVAQELLAGARSRFGRRAVETLLAPFEKAHRMITPSHREWRETGAVLAEILERRQDLKSKLPALVNDCLLALSARAIGATLYTRNRDDFIMIRQMRPFSLIIVG